MEQSEIFPFCPESRAMKQILHSLDGKFLQYELTMEAQAQEIDELRKENSEMMTKQLDDGNKMVADTLKACFMPAFDVLNPASAVIIERISEMQTIEQVHEFINDMKEQSKDFISSLKEQTPE